MEPRQLTALIVEDDMVIRMVHQKILNRVGLKIQVAENGKEAIEIHGSGQSFDLILMDRDMPVMNGIEVTFFFPVLYIISTTNRWSSIYTHDPYCFIGN